LFQQCSRLVGIVQSLLALLLSSEFLLIVFARLTLAVEFSSAFDREFSNWLYGVASVAQLFLNRDRHV
jgi:hypothetical protein